MQQWAAAYLCEWVGGGLRHTHLEVRDRVGVLVPVGDREVVLEMDPVLLSNATTKHQRYRKYIRRGRQCLQSHIYWLLQT